MLAPFIGVSLQFSILPQLIGFMLLLAFTISGLGLLISSLMKTTESFGLLMQRLIFPMFFVSGAFFPLTAVPTWMDIVARINPLSYGVDAFRQILLTNQVPQQVLHSLILHSRFVNATFLLGFALVMISAAVYAFNKKA